MVSASIYKIRSISVFFLLFLLVSSAYMLFSANNHQRVSTHFRQTGVEQLPKIQLKIPDAGPMSELFLRELTKEPETNQLLFTFIEKSQSKSLIFDAGAHVGDTSLWLAKFAKDLSRDIKIITADPNKQKIEFINKVAKFNGLENLIIVHTAVGDERSKGEEITTRKKFTSYFAKKLASPMYQVKPNPNGTITIRTIDEIIESSHVEEYPLGLLHLDVEGYESLAMHGAKNQIEKNKPLAIVELNKQTEKWITTAMEKKGYRTSKKISHKFNNTIYYSQKKLSQKKLLESLDLL